nr:hypothetical protein [uncultured Microbacterium sp.]
MIRRRVIAGAAGIALLMGVGAVPPAQQTDAYFTDTEYIAASTFTAATLQPSVVTACTIQNLSVIGLGLVFQSVTLTWTSPHPPSMVKLTLSNATQTGVVPAASISSSGPVNGIYSYSTTLSQALLESLVGNLLGSTTTLTVTNVVPNSSWTSTPVTRTLTIALLGLLARCTA